MYTWSDWLFTIKYFPVRQISAFPPLRCLNFLLERPNISWIIIHFLKPVGDWKRLVFSNTPRLLRRGCPGVCGTSDGSLIRMKLPLAGHRVLTSPSKEKLLPWLLKSNYNIFPRLKLAYRAIDGDVWLRTIEYLMQCLQKKATAPVASTLIVAKFLDSAAVVQILNLCITKTSLEYVQCCVSQQCLRIPPELI